MDWDDSFDGGFASVVERLLYIGFSAVLFLLLLAVLALLARFLWIGTRAAQIYVREHEPPRPPRSTEYVQNTPRGPVPAGPAGGPSVPPPGAQTTPRPAPAAGPVAQGRPTGSASGPQGPQNPATAQTVPLPESTATAPTVPLTDAAGAPTGGTASAAHPVGRSAPRKPRLPKSPS
jgi:cytoskeletal protein RodZ